MTAGIADCEQAANQAQIGNYLITIGTLPYGGSVTNNQFGGMDAGISWSITLQSRTNDMLDLVHDNLANSPYAEKANIAYNTIAIDGKQGAYAFAPVDLPIMNPISHQIEANPTTQGVAIFHVNDQVDCFIDVLGAQKLFQDIITTIHVEETS